MVDDSGKVKLFDDFNDGYDVYNVVQKVEKSFHGMNDDEVNDVSYMLSC